MNQEEIENLKMEVGHFYKCLFIMDPPSAIIKMYIEAHGALPDMLHLPDEELNTVRRIVEKKLDACAIEPWLRKQNKRHTLSAKMYMIIYFVESSGDLKGIMRSSDLSILNQMHVLICGIFSLMRGLYLKAAYGLV